MEDPDSSNADLRGETAAQQADRNWTELLQEMRVTQMGVQILTGFLLTLPFQARFGLLDDVQRVGYLVVVTLSVLATAFMIAPVAYHRWVFGTRRKAWLVRVGHRMVGMGLAALVGCVSGVIWLVFDMVVNRTVSTIMGVALFLVYAILWWGVPLRSRGA
ncbi:MAG: DUF6328 family protein [Nocardioidaceae bacterium]